MNLNCHIKIAKQSIKVACSTSANPEKVSGVNLHYPLDLVIFAGIPSVMRSVIIVQVQGKRKIQGLNSGTLCRPTTLECIQPTNLLGAIQANH